MAKARTKRRRWAQEERRRIFEKSNGNCHGCWKQLSWSNYNAHGKRGAWQVDHSKAIARGGTNHQNNVFAICIPCNIDKSAKPTRVHRQKHGRKRAPYSKAKVATIREGNKRTGTTLGLAGFAVHPVVGIATALFGRHLGAKVKVK